LKTFNVYCCIYMAFKACQEYYRDSSICPKGGLIFNGVKTEPGEAPYMAIIEAWNDTFIHKCGGALVHNQYVLTAAHCILEARAENTSELYRYKVVQNFSYNYDGLTIENDILLIKLNETVKFNENIRPACLPSVEYPIQESDKLFLYGFGGRNSTEASTEVLLKARMSVISDTKFLNEKYEHINATGYNITSDACGGDSGGPLVRRHPFYKPCLSEVMAVVSDGPYCDSSAPETLYTNVLHYLPWIHKVLWNISENHVRPRPKPFFK
ncbi:hypothetical protein KR067_011815, partial [Drosophila pandora]